MHSIFVRKSNYFSFLGMVIWVCTASVFLVNCKDEEEEKNLHENNTFIKENTTKNATSKIIDDKATEGKRVIYLTFDDGPNRGSENLLHILEKRKVVATTFVVGKHATGSFAQKKMMHTMANTPSLEIANHSYTHAGNQYSKFYKNPQIVVQDFDIARDSLQLKSNIARTPGRNIWRINGVNSTDIKASKEAADELSKNGYKLVGWDLEWKPNNEMKLKGTHQMMLKKVDSIFFNDLEKTSRHLVFLTHDQYLQDEESVMEFDSFIEKLQNSNRFVFKKISEYPKINDGPY